MSNLKKILTDSAINIDHMADLLNDQDIPSMIKNNNQSASLAGFGSVSNNVDLFVNEGDAENALKIIKQHQNS